MCPSYFYWQKLTCASVCESMGTWNELLIMIRRAEPQHMKITLTGGIHEHVRSVFKKFKTEDVSMIKSFLKVY